MVLSCSCSFVYIFTLWRLYLKCRLKVKYLNLMVVRHLSVYYAIESTWFKNPFSLLKISFWVFVAVQALKTYWKRWCKKEGIGVHALKDRKNEFLCIVDIRIESKIELPRFVRSSKFYYTSTFLQKATKSFGEGTEKDNREITQQIYLCSCQ